MSRQPNMLPAPSRLSEPTRLSAPVILPKATEYSDDPQLNSPLTMILRAKGLGYRYAKFRDAVRIDHRWGPRRSEGDWGLAFLEFTMSRCVDLEPWYHQRYDNMTFWRACGFKKRPSKSLVYERTKELEQFAAVFDELAAELTRLAARKDPNIGRWVFIDGTEAETHAAAHHDCRPEDDCPDRGVHQLQRLNTAGARRVRHDQTLDPSPYESPDESEAGERTGRRFRLGDHWWYLRDATAGRRAYKGKDGTLLRVWDGYHQIVAVDVYTGAMLAGHVQSASTQEVEAYIPTMERVQKATGRTPFAVVADRGFSYRKVFEYNTRRGIGSVIPYRRHGHNQPERPPATDRWDEQGVPFCKYCGGGSDLVKSFVDRGMPRIWFRCALPQTSDCLKDQSINCAADFRRLLPLWETHEAYAILSEARSEYERIHDLNRDRYRIGPDCLALRPKRIGAAWQQLRVSAAIVIEWLRVCFRQGWLGKGGRHEQPRRRTSKSVLQRTLDTRAKLGRWGGGIAGRRSRAGPAPPG